MAIGACVLEDSGWPERDVWRAILFFACPWFLAFREGRTQTPTTALQNASSSARKAAAWARAVDVPGPGGGASTVIRGGTAATKRQRARSGTVFHLVTRVSRRARSCGTLSVEGDRGDGGVMEA